jgi:chromosome segregation ATPase
VVTVDESTGSDSDEAVLSALYANVESLAHEATRANELAQTLRTAIDDARRELDGLRTEHESKQRSIEEELARARADADASVASIREQLDGAQRELEEVRGSHVVLESEVLRLEQTRNEVRDELADLQARLFGMLPAIDRVQSAQRELAAALEPTPEEGGDGEASGDEEVLPSRPIGRLMDASDEEDA